MEYSRDLILLIFLCFLYFVWVTVPLIPAVIIYRLFPTVNTDAQWKILGIALKAGGASGFYFAILGLGFFRFLDPSTNWISDLKHPYWTVETKVKFYDADHNTINPKTNSLDKISVQPFAYDFRQTDEQSWLVTLKFSELNSDTDSIRLNFPEGVGFIPLRDLMTRDNTSTFYKTVNLTKGKPTEIHPPVTGGQNQPVVATYSRKLEQSLETNDVGPRGK
jgi:hypothetical protein